MGITFWPEFEQSCAFPKIRRRTRKKKYIKTQNDASALAQKQPHRMLGGEGGGEGATMMSFLERRPRSPSLNLQVSVGSLGGVRNVDQIRALSPPPLLQADRKMHVGGNRRGMRLKKASSVHMAVQLGYSRRFIISVTELYS